MESIKYLEVYVLTFLRCPHD